MVLSFNNISEASARIKEFVVKTPVITNHILNQKLGAEIHFKCENFQTTGSFKLRGALNKILQFKEENGYFPEKIVAVSSGNHAQAVAFVANKFGIKALIYMEQNASPYKVELTRYYGAEVVLTKTKKETEIFAEEKIKEGYFYIHSSNSEQLISGQGTACFEALEQIGGEVDAVFAGCGGGGLIAGTYLACQSLKILPKVFAAEPLFANDTAISYRQGKIFSFDQTPKTIADGARTLRPSETTFPYIQKLDGVYEIEDQEIIRWTQIISANLKIFIEPTASLPMAAAYQFLQKEKAKKILIILSGGNMSQETAAQVWKDDYLDLSIMPGSGLKILSSK